MERFKMKIKVVNKIITMFENVMIINSNTNYLYIVIKQETLFIYSHKAKNMFKVSNSRTMFGKKTYF